MVGPGREAVLPFGPTHHFGRDTSTLRAVVDARRRIATTYCVNQRRQDVRHFSDTIRRFRAVPAEPARSCGSVSCGTLARRDQFRLARLRATVSPAQGHV